MRRMPGTFPSDIPSSMEQADERSAINTGRAVALFSGRGPISFEVNGPGRDPAVAEFLGFLDPPDEPYAAKRARRSTRRRRRIATRRVFCSGSPRSAAAASAPIRAARTKAGSSKNAPSITPI